MEQAQLDPVPAEWWERLEALRALTSADKAAEADIEPGWVWGAALATIASGSLRSLSLARSDDPESVWAIADTTRKLAKDLFHACRHERADPGPNLAASFVLAIQAIAEGSENTSNAHAAVAAVNYLYLNWDVVAGAPENSQVIAAQIVEHTVQFLISNAHPHEARELTEAAPEALKTKHPAWHEVAEMGAQHAREAYMARATLRLGSPQTTAASVREYGQNLPKSEIRDRLERYAQQLQDGQGDPEVLMQLLDEVSAELDEQSRNNSIAGLKHEAIKLHWKWEEQDRQEIARRIDRLRDIAHIFHSHRHFDDCTLCHMHVAWMEHKLENKDGCQRALIAALEHAEIRLWHNPAPFAGGDIEGMRWVYDNAVWLFANLGNCKLALYLAERYKDLLAARIQDRAALLPGGILDEAAPTPRIRGWALSYWLLRTRVMAFVRTPAGEVTAHVTMIPRDDIATETSKLTPNVWRQLGIFPSIAPRVIETLSAIIPKMDVPAGEVLTISPDGVLHNAPWTLMQLNGAAMVETVPTQCVMALPYHDRAPAEGSLPPNAVLFSAPALDESEPAAWDDWVERLRADLSKAGLHVTAYRNADADVNTCQAALVTPNLVHVRSHGYFPDFLGGRDNDDAFVSSGLLLAQDGQLARRDGAAIANLTPASVRAATKDHRLGAKHVTLEACVSGVSQESITTAPISLPWMISVFGAETILASTWNIEREAAEEVCLEFYDQWLNKGVTRAEALRVAICKAMKSFGPAAAGFRLLGNGYDGP